LNRRRSRRLRTLWAGVAVAAALTALVAALLLGVPRWLPENTAAGRADESPAAPTCDAATDPVGCDYRGAFVDALRVFQRDLRPDLDAISLAVWDPDAYQRIAALEEQATAAFDRGEHREAFATITEAAATAQQSISRSADLFADSVRRARDGLAADDFTAANAAIRQALLIDPQDPQAIALGQRIDVLPQVVDLLQSASIAQAENRSGDEADLLRQALALDPAREPLRERLDELDAAEREQRYAREIRAAEAALAAGELARARERAASARRLYPQRDLSFLLDRIEQAELTAALSRQLGQARDAASARDWARALDAWRNVLALEPTNAEAVQGEALATAVIAGIETISQYNAEPLRLASDPVAQTARTQLARYAGYSGDSPVLARALDTLAQYLELRDIPADVTILSDGRTDITVRRVGRVGRTESRVIRLPPGEYDIEGRREGHKSTLVHLVVPFGSSTLEVRVVCDEPV
jgi:hypothetical protein